MWLRGTKITIKCTDVVDVVRFDLLFELLFLFVQLGGCLDLPFLSLDELRLFKVLLFLLFLLLQSVQVLPSLPDVFSQHSKSVICWLL
jgi:hypothetical protein